MEHLTSLPKRGASALSTVSVFNHERAPTSCLQQLEGWVEALEANNWTQLELKQIIGHKITYNRISDGKHSVARGVHLLRKDALY